MSQCEWIQATGQCPNDAATDSRFCAKHQPSGKGELRKYLITSKLFKESAHRHIAASDLVGLREEIALARALVENRLNLVDNDIEMITAMPTIQSGLQTIEKLVQSAYQIEFKLGNLLNKGSVIHLAQSMIEILDDELKGVPGRNEILERVGSRVAEAIAAQENKDKNPR